MQLSIVILNYNTVNLLRLCLRNLLNLPLDFPYEIIVVDNASKDGSLKMMREKFPQIKVITSSKNIGHARGNNLGLKVAQGKYILILNTDIIFTRASDFQKIFQFLDSHPEVALLGPKLLNGDGTIQASSFRPYRWVTPIYRRTPLGRMKFARADLSRHLMWDFDRQSDRPVDWILGACMFIRQDFVEKFGGFNEKLFLYFADYELCDRVRAQGYQVYYLADTKIIHYHKRESAHGSVWSGLGSLFNYVTRVHLIDWLKYLKISKSKI